MAHYLSEVTLQKLDARREDFGPDFGFEGGSPTKRPLHQHESLSEAIAGQGAGSGKESLGLTHAGDINGYIRAATVSAKQDQQGQLHKVVWCGEQDGAIVVRDFKTGDPMVNIERKNKVFVFCLVTVGEMVWAGLSDGYIRVFEGATCGLLDEAKAHSGSILSMILIPPPTQDRSSVQSPFGTGIVCTGSNDWTIALWDTETLQCLGRLTGHKNAVRCLASPMTLNQLPNDAGSPDRTTALYCPHVMSASDDGTIKCWNLLHREEVHYNPPENGEPGWPITGLHKRGVTGLCVLPTSVILTTGQDGVCNAFDLGTGCFIQQVESRPCAILSVLYDEVMDHVWIGGMDGIISLYETRSLQRLTSLFAHSGTYVASIKAIARTNVLKLWTLDNQNGTVMEAVFGDGAQEWCPAAQDPTEIQQISVDATTGETIMIQNLDENNAGGGGENTLVKQQQLQQYEIDRLREETLRNYAKLDQYRTKLRVIEDRDAAQREGISAKLGDRGSLKAEYLIKVREWYQKHQLMKRQRALASWLGRFSQRRTARRFMNKWLSHITSKFEIRRKAAIAEGLQRNDEATLKSRYCLLLYDAAMRADRKRRQRRTAELFVSNTQRGLMSNYFHMWLRAKKQIKLAKAQNSVIGVIAGRMDQGMLKEYWAKLMDMIKEEKEFQSKCKVIDALLRTNKRTLLYAYYENWMRACFTRKKTALQRNASKMLSYKNKPSTTKTCFHIWMNYLGYMRKKKADDRAAEVEKERQMWEQLVSGDDESLNPDRIAQDMRLVEQQLALRKKQRQDLEDEITGLHVETNALQREMLSLNEGFAIGQALDQSQTPRERAAVLMALLKAKGINCFHDLNFVADARDRSSQPLLENQTSAGAVSLASAGRQASNSSATSRSRLSAGSRATTPRGGASSTGTRPTTQLDKAQVAAQHFAKILRATQTTLFNALRYQGFRVKDFKVPPPEEDPMGNGGRKLDWGIPVTYLESLKAKERKEIFGLMKGLVVVWDVVTAENNCYVEDVHWCEFISNSHLFLKMTNEEFDRIQKERLGGAGQEYMKVESLEAIQPVDSLMGSINPSGPISPRSPQSAPSPSKKPSPPAGKKSTPGVKRPASPGATKRPTAKSPAPTARKTAPTASPQKKTSSTTAPAPAKVAPKPSARPGSAPAGSAPAGVAAGKPWLGIKLTANKIQPTAQEKASGLKTAKTVVDISDCTEGSPAYDAGLRVGDRLHRFGGLIVTDVPSFNAVASKQVKIGAEIPVQHIPQGATDPVDAVIVVRPKE